MISTTFRLYAIVFLLAMLLVSSRQGAAQTASWTAHTSMREVVALSVSDDAVWAATTGGVFSYNPTAGELQRFTVAQGLHNVQTRAIAYDPHRNAVWVGYNDGALDRIDVATGQVRTFLDIERNERFPQREINRLNVQGDSLLVATAFGVVVFDPVRLEVRDTYSQFGTFSSAIPVRDVIVAPLPEGPPGLWVATEEGVAYASLHAVNLQDPGVWMVEQDALPDDDVFALAFFDGAMYVGTGAGLASREADGAYTLYPISNRPVYDLVSRGTSLVAIDDFKVYEVFDSGQAGTVAQGFVALTGVAVGPEGNVWVGERATGLNAFTAGSSPMPLHTEVYPEGPFDGNFADLTVDAEGNLWAGGTGNAGFYQRAPDGQWTSYTGRFFEELQGRARFPIIHAGAQGSLWAASPGNGLAQVTSEGELVVYDRTNSTLRSDAPNNPDFIFVSGVATETDGTLWVTNRAAPNPLHVRTPDGQWTAFPPPSGCTGLVSASVLGPIFIDSFGQKWIVVVNPSDFQATIGLLVLDTGASPTSREDDACRFINQVGSNQQQGLPSTTITSITEDREGFIWIGTGAGPAFVIGSALAAQDVAAQPGKPINANRTSDGGTFILQGQAVNDVAVDPSNRLWMGTNQGAFLLEPVEGGYVQVQHYTTANSPLFSNNIVAVAVDGHTGEVYFATDQGLISIQGDALNPAPAKRDLFIYPNPVRVSDEAAPEIVIEGLVEETDVRVVTPHGEVVAQFDVRGGRARWDGRDRNRELVPSGVYLIVAIGQNGEGTAYGKVAVIR